MPVYNGERHLKEAISSILNQTFSDFEFLIINDGSTDQSEKIINSYNDDRIRYLNNEGNKGLIFTLNRGIEMAEGKYIARMDQDDISFEDRLKEQYDFLEENLDIALVGGWAEIINESGEKIGNYKTPVNHYEIKFDLLFHNPFVHGTIFFRKNIVKELGGYNEKDKYAEDYGLYSTAIQNYKMANLPEFLIRYRIHNSSIGQAPQTKTIQDETAKKISFNNINRYIDIDRDDFTKYYEVLNNRNSNFRDFLKYLKINKNIYNRFIKKEKLDKEQVKNIYHMYTSKNRAIIKNRYKFIYRLFKKINPVRDMATDMLR